LRRGLRRGLRRAGLVEVVLGIVGASGVRLGLAGH